MTKHKLGACKKRCTHLFFTVSNKTANVAFILTAWSLYICGFLKRLKTSHFFLFYCFFEESVKMSHLLTEKRLRKTKGCVLQRDRRHCHLRALMWFLKSTLSFSSPPTSVWVTPMSNLKPGKAAGLGSEFRENGKAADLLWEVPWSGEPPGLKLKCQGENADFSEFVL